MVFKNIVEFKWLKLSTTILLSGFFMGYNLGFLDLAWIPFPILVPYLAKETSFNHYFAPLVFDKLDYVKYTLAEAVVVLGGGVLIGLVTAGALFLLGLSMGSSLPTIMEYAKALTLAQSVTFIILYACSLMLLGALGLSLGASILHLARNTVWKIDRRTYDSFLLGLAFLILSIAVEVL
ncbi:MAG: hypothetical protein QXG01_05840 [Candidatus Bathyarchaeia archaeon]